MRVALSCALLAGAVQAALFSPKGPVQKLDMSNFDKEVMSIEKPTMVAFTAPWCGHCKNLVPHYVRVASELDGVVKITYVDCEDKGSEPLCAKYGIRGFPTLKLFPATKKRVPRDYNGERTAKAISEYVVSALPAEAVKRLEPKKLKDFVNKYADDRVVLLISPKSKSSPMYRSLALDFRGHVPFGYLYATKEEAFKAAKDVLGVSLDIRSVPALYVVSGGAGSPTLHKYRGSMKYRHIKRWLDEAIDGKVAPEEPETPAEPEADVPPTEKGRAEGDVPIEQFKRKGMSDEEVEAAVRLGEKLGETSDPETERQEAEKRKKERLAAKRKIDAIRRASRKLGEKGTAPEKKEHKGPITEQMLIDQMQDLIGDKWGSAIAARAVEAREVAEKVLSENPAKAMQATEEAEMFLIKGTQEDIRAIEDQINAGVDEEGYPLTKDMEETLAKHHEMLTGMVYTLQLRMDTRKGKKHETEVAEEILARYDL